MNDDLLSTVALYATTKVVLNLMAFAPTIRLPEWWRQKCLRETQGLMLDDKAVEDWYAYYLVVNNTLYGNVLTVDRESGDTEYHRDPIIFEEEVESYSVISGKGIYTVRQYADMDIVLTTASMTLVKMGNLGRKIKSMCAILSSNQRNYVATRYAIYLADEYGDVWSFTEKDEGGFVLEAKGMGIVSLRVYAMFYGEEYVSALSRDGLLSASPPYEEREDMTLNVIRSPRLYKVVGQYPEEVLVTSMGERVTKNTRDGGYLTSTITKGLQGALHGAEVEYIYDVVYIREKELVAITTDRTVLDLANDNRYAIGITQRVRTDGRLLYALVDPQ